MWCPGLRADVVSGSACGCPGLRAVVRVCVRMWCPGLRAGVRVCVRVCLGVPSLKGGLEPVA
eukprot:8488190-Pyramimonas_sp.AAC.1